LNIKGLFVFFFVQFAIANIHASEPVELHPDQQLLLKSTDPQLAANKKLVYEFWRKVFQTRDMSKADKYLAEGYIQHNPKVPTGRAGFVNAFSKAKVQPVKAQVDNLVSIVAERDIVVLAFKKSGKSKKTGAEYTTTWFDMFRIKGGKIVEHWDPAKLK